MSRKNLRFVKDYNLPINIFNDEMFSYYRELYKDFWPFEAEALMNKEIEKLNGNVDEWLAEYGHLRDNIINTLENSEEYKKFNSCDMSVYDIPNIGVGERSVFTEECHGRIFVSVDLKKANFQALKYVGVINDITYESFVKRFGGSDYFAGSKYLRQVIFGKLNPKRQVKVEKFLINKVREYIDKNYPKWELFSFNSDELIYEIPINKDLIGNWNVLGEYVPEDDAVEYMEDKIFDNFGINVRIEPITVKRLNIVNCNGNKVDAYVRRNLITKKEVLKKASTTFYPQIYKLWKNMEINDNDLMVYFDDQIAKFVNPLILQ